MENIKLHCFNTLGVLSTKVVTYGDSAPYLDPIFLIPLPGDGLLRELQIVHFGQPYLMQLKAAKSLFGVAVKRGVPVAVAASKQLFNVLHSVHVMGSVLEITIPCYYHYYCHLLTKFWYLNIARQQNFLLHRQKVFS